MRHVSPRHGPQNRVLHAGRCRRQDILRRSCRPLHWKNTVDGGTYTLCDTHVQALTDLNRWGLFYSIGVKRFDFTAYEHIIYTFILTLYCFCQRRRRQGVRLSLDKRIFGIFIRNTASRNTCSLSAELVVQSSRENHARKCFFQVKTHYYYLFFLFPPNHNNIDKQKPPFFRFFLKIHPSQQYQQLTWFIHVKGHQPPLQKKISPRNPFLRCSWILDAPNTLLLSTATTRRTARHAGLALLLVRAGNARIFEKSEDKYNFRTYHHVLPRVPTRSFTNPAIKILRKH